MFSPMTTRKCFILFGFEGENKCTYSYSNVTQVPTHSNIYLNVRKLSISQNGLSDDQPEVLRGIFAIPF